MATKKNNTPTDTEIIISKLKIGKADIWIKGLTPFLCSAVSSKTIDSLLSPKDRKSAASKAQNLKHKMYDEFVDSMYQAREEDGNLDKTRILGKAAMFKASMATAALEIPGAKKTQIGRLVQVLGDYVEIYGVPCMHLSVVRNSGMDRTMDVHPKALIKDWCCKITVTFTMPTVSMNTVYGLLETAGQIIGVGDFRPEKGKGTFGMFTTCEESDVKDIIKNGGLKAQDAAIKTPMFYDRETEQIYKLHQEYREKRGM